MADPNAFPPHDGQLPPPPHDFHGGDDPDGAGPGGAHGAGGAKRKRQSEGPGSRSKRSRYISIACNECKRRKIKCNGEMPCGRCGNLNLECIYAPNCCTSNFRDTTEFKQMTQHLFALHDYVEGLWHTVNHIRTLLPHAEIPMPPAPPPRDPFAGYGEPRGLSPGATSPQPAQGAHAPQAQMLNIDPSLGPRKSLDDGDDGEHGHAHGVDDQTQQVHTQHTHAPASPHAHMAPPAPQRYTTASNASAPRDSSQLSYELARASMESMGIAGAAGARDAGGPHHGGQNADGAPDETAAAVAAAAAAAAAGAEEQRNGAGGAGHVEPDHQRALAELLHNAELQQQLQAASGTGGANGHANGAGSGGGNGNGAGAAAGTARQVGEAVKSE